MATIFESRRLVRDELVALFVATGSWNKVSGYDLGVNSFGSQASVLTIMSTGTTQLTNSADMNPTSYSFLITNYIKSYMLDLSWTATDAMDSLDARELIIRQTLFDNRGDGTNYNLLRFDTSTSVVGEKLIEGLVYLVEELTIFADLPTGHKI